MNGDVVAIRTARLRLEPLTVGHADEMHAVYADDAMYRFTGGTAPSLEGLRERYRAMAVGRSPGGTEQWLNWILRLDDDAIGAVQATIITDGGRAILAWEVGVAWQGNGYASEATVAVVDWLERGGAHSIEAHVHPDHIASQRVARAAGLVRTDAVIDDEQVWRRER